MIESLLIANRGEIACRIIQTANSMGIRTVAVFSDADAQARHVELADEAVHIGATPVGESYLDGNKIIAAALASGAQAIHPGYGFLSENPDFVEAVTAARLIFVGPTASAIRAMGLKDAAKILMEKAGVPVVPGYHGSEQSPDFLAQQAELIGYPVLIKARAGGGGKGMRRVDRAEDFEQALESAAREGLSAFGDAAVLVEKYILSPRHIEVQVFGDSHGNVVHLFERDCSLQRRHQKVIEEAPAPGMSEAVRAAMTTAAVTAAQAINYEGAGTIEFIVDGSQGLRVDGFWFMEMNTRLQVEHPVTEAITGQDLVEAQIRVAAGEVLPFTQNELSIQGHAFEARLYAEDVPAGFLPATGHLQRLTFDPRVRNDTGVRSGDDITPFYDPMIAKIITHADTREQALKQLSRALQNTQVAGTVTNVDFLGALARHPLFVEGMMDTGLIERELDTLTAVEPASMLSTLVAALSLADVDFNESLSGWRLWGSASHLLTMHCQREVQTLRYAIAEPGHYQLLDVDSRDVQLDVRIQPLSADCLVVEVNGLKKRVSVVRWDEPMCACVSVSAEGRTLEFRCPDPLESAKESASNADFVSAPMTGVIRLVDVLPGQSVKEGQRLLVLEAMKMETSVLAPRDGVVEQVHCRVEGTVDGGSLLVSLVKTEQP
ncbi:acetyl/propionyl/methylcrotonyl-CoA carboxylase subunit alpha [Granulosicoccus antarcticus]|uniref:Biotin carboxylase n=1 Tax=Granulosicoccus antarcticus IMCC3135 TaxID=1192854 RepID=A0A2Z2NXH6_9GAMM|nr:biotin carboxylase N-terminal domain-containing protein [Granulosicoccus antarcticus]ASJ74468.1 Acetyl-/propionyl-coenzyme A carboxylase alpha chain [Granulosicoccus antarcticus IMCC3135]